MKQRYSIWGREYGSDHDVEIIQVNSNPETMRKALGLKTLSITHNAFGGVKKKSKTTRYSYLRIVENKE